MFPTKHKLRKAGKINITCQGTDIKQNSQVIYLVCILNEALPGKPMAYKAIKKTNYRLNFLFRKNCFLTSGLIRPLCKASIQSHFDYACSAWYPNLRPDLKICWFAIAQLGLQETCGSKNVFEAHSWKKIFFSHKYIFLATLTLESKVNFLLLLLHHFLAVHVVLTFLTHCSLCRFHQTVLH